MRKVKKSKEITLTSKKKCKVCGGFWDNHSNNNKRACLVKQFSLPENWVYTPESLLAIAINEKLLLEWGQPSPGVTKIRLRSTGKTVHTTDPLTYLTEALLLLPESQE
jgi:hypothetical protein